MRGKAMEAAEADTGGGRPKTGLDAVFTAFEEQLSHLEDRIREEISLISMAEEDIGKLKKNPDHARAVHALELEMEFHQAELARHRGERELLVDKIRKLR